MSPFETYRNLKLRVLRGRAQRTLDPDMEDQILDAMDGLWYAMSEAERARIDAEVVFVSATPDDVPIIEFGPTYKDRPTYGQSSLSPRAVRLAKQRSRRTERRQRSTAA